MLYTGVGGSAGGAGMEGAPGAAPDTFSLAAEAMPFLLSDCWDMQKRFQSSAAKIHLSV